MSHPHRITIAASVRETVRGCQSSRRTIVLDAAGLPRERLREMLLEELRRRGFRQELDGSMERQRGSALERVDPHTLVATSEVESEATIDEKQNVTVGSSDPRGGPEVRAARERIEKRIRDGARKRFERDLASRVEASGAELERDLNEAIARVYADAMREKAATLGEVGSELVLEIKVKVSD